MDARRRIFFISVTDFLLDQAVEAVSAVSVQGRVGNGRVVGGEEFVELLEVLSGFVSFEFVFLGADDDHGRCDGTEPFVGFHVDRKAGMAQVDQKAHHGKARGAFDVVVDEGGPGVFVFLACLGKAVARQVDEVPFLALFHFVHGSPGLDGVVVDGPCLARFAADVGELSLPAEVVDEGGFPYVGTPDEGDFFPPVVHVLLTVDG